jgi:hypothetical protein
MRIPLFMPAQRPALHEPGPAPLREADVDDIEVLRDDRLREDGSRLPEDLGPEVAVREVREREHAHAGGRGELGCACRSRVQGLVGALSLLVRERRLVDENVSLSRCLQNRACGTRVPGEDDLPAGSRRAENMLRAHRLPVGKLDHIAALQASEERTFRDAEGLRGVEVEAAGPGVLHERVAVRRQPVLDRECLDPVVLPVEAVPGAELLQRELVAEPSEDAPENAEELFEARRPVDGQGHLAPSESEGLQHPGQAEVVICVVMRQKDLGELDEPDRGAQELALRALAAVEEDSLTSTAQQRAGEPAFRGRDGTRGSEEDEIEIHRRSVGGGRSQV